MAFVIFAVLLGLIPAILAQAKGRSFVLWWIYGAAIFIVALPHSLMLKSDKEKVERRQIEDGLKKCPMCAEMIKAEAIKCKHCGSDLTQDAASAD